MNNRLAASLAAAGALAFAAPVCADTPAEAVADDHSAANVDQFRLTHLDLDLTVDFDARQLQGSVVLYLERLDPRAAQLVLDERDLAISGVTQLSADILGSTEKPEPVWVSRPFHTGKRDPILGSPLIIDLPASGAATETIKIEYATSPGAAALQWLAPTQTAGKSQPFLITQSEPIGARSWIPLQDTPQVRVTYRAVIHTPGELIAVMSAVNDPKVKRTGEYVFVDTLGISPYRIALAVGNLAFKATGPRTGVYAERPLLGAALREFSDGEAMLKTGEALCGAYRWGRYDVLVLPPGSTARGTANPRLSFVPPTAVAGDKSSLPTINRQLAHAWAGNLTGNATWRDLWLNEGLAAYLGGRVTAVLYGERRGQLDGAFGLKALRDGLATLPPADQVLAIDLRGRDPAVGFDQIPSEKGRLFFAYLAAKFGAPRLDEFLRGYFDRYAFQSLTTEQFLEALQQNLLDRFPGIVSRRDVLAWIMDPGLPANAVLPDADVLRAVDEARTRWLQGGTPAQSLGTQDWVSAQWVYFLGGLPPAVPVPQLADLDRAFGFTRSRNAQLELAWLALAIRNGYQPASLRLEEHLKTVGQPELVVPLYEELMRSAAGTAVARRVYSQARPGYHPSLTAILDALVLPNPKTEHR
jgi:leukotriene-A4 hydrolase